jgi:hypothetical protein
MTTPSSDAVERPRGLHATLTWEPYLHVGDGYKAHGFRRSDDAGYALPVYDPASLKPTGEWWATWAHPMMCGRPGWHHHALGAYSSANAAAMAFDSVYELERLAGNTDRCKDAQSNRAEPSEAVVERAARWLYTWTGGVGFDALRPDDKEHWLSHSRKMLAALRAMPACSGCEVLREALEHARQAIESLDDDALGRSDPNGEVEPWPLKLELLAAIDAALSTGQGKGEGE